MLFIIVSLIALLLISHITGAPVNTPRHSYTSPFEYRSTDYIGTSLSQELLDRNSGNAGHQPLGALQSARQFGLVQTVWDINEDDVTSPIRVQIREADIEVSADADDDDDASGSAQSSSSDQLLHATDRQQSDIYGSYLHHNSFIETPQTSRQNSATHQPIDLSDLYRRLQDPNFQQSSLNGGRNVQSKTYQVDENLLMQRRPVDSVHGDCSVCLNTLKDPVSLDCRHCFCFDCIKQWLLISGNCPNCRQPDSAAREIIDDDVES
ncbi:hypothetical protein MP228_010828 [Amoeboaphelidium protococcarum]|nr:hypothetical protein MP228_010828 [Amoeboaphelidium protococcarum]